MREVYDIRPHKTETRRTRLAEGRNILDYPGEVITSTTDLITMKIHVNSSLVGVKSRYMCMYMRYFYLNNMMDKSEYIMIHISTIPQEFVEK